MKKMEKINCNNWTGTGLRRKNRGLVIIAVLWMVVVLMVMTAILGRKSRLDMKVCLARMEAVQCRWACRAGIEKAIAVLNIDETENDSFMDVWNDNAEDFNDVILNQCRFTVRVVDESSKLNINTATKEQLMGLPDMVEEIADAIIDWRDSDDTPSGAGVESGYYESLPYGYMAGNGPFTTLRELQLVKDVTEELFYGEDTNLNGLLDYNERDGQVSPPADDGDNVLDVGWAAYLTCYPIESSESETEQSSEEQTQSSETQQQSSENQQQSESQQSSGDQQQTPENQQQESENQDRSSSNQGQSSENNEQNSSNPAQAGNAQQTSENAGQTAADTSQTSGTSQTLTKVNVNTASDIVLAALLGGSDQAYRTAQEIVAYRDSLAEGIEDISELTDEGILSDDVFEEISDNITTSSDIFMISCVTTGERNGTKVRGEAVIDRSTRPCRILFRYQETGN